VKINAIDLPASTTCVEPGQKALAEQLTVSLLGRPPERLRWFVF
jgi:hypothetical protein